MAQAEPTGSEENGHKERLLELARSTPEGISNEQIKTCLSTLSLNGIAVIINKCLKDGSLELFTKKDSNQLFYKFKDTTKRTKGADSEEKIVYKIIEEAGNKGIWIRDIRVKSNLNMTLLTKVLKSLETKKFIKAVKSVAANRKKLYMLYDLEADTSVTGGAWYQDQDFESEFVDLLNDCCYRYLKKKADDAADEASNKGEGPLFSRNKSYASAKDVADFISDVGISKVPLSVQDIEMILYTVVLDNKAERTKAVNGSYMYRAVSKFIPSPGLVKSTCGICPLIKKCNATGEINPTYCEFLTEWLQL